MTISRVIGPYMHVLTGFECTDHRACQFESNKVHSRGFLPWRSLQVLIGHGYDSFQNTYLQPQRPFDSQKLF